jgi:hypothetical protein
MVDVNGGRDALAPQDAQGERNDLFAIALRVEGSPSYDGRVGVSHLLAELAVGTLADNGEAGLAPQPA